MVIVLGVLFTVNTYAWFTYFNKFDGNITADVVGWDVTFFDDETSMGSFIIVDELFPGMREYKKEIRVNNNGDVDAEFDFSVLSFSLFGDIYEIGDDYTDENLLDYLNNYFPFSIEFYSDKKIINSKGDFLIFKINVNWEFESKEEFFKVNKFINYSESFDYYKIINGEYVIDEAVNEENFYSKIEEGLYIESDDADSYWGNKAAEYKKQKPGESCLSMSLKLSVSQTNKES